MSDPDVVETVAEDVVDALGVALQLLALAVKIAPSLGSWLGDLVAGKTDPVSLRVADILPATSASRQAQQALGG